MINIPPVQSLYNVFVIQEDIDEEKHSFIKRIYGISYADMTRVLKSISRRKRIAYKVVETTLKLCPSCGNVVPFDTESESFPPHVMWTDTQLSKSLCPKSDLRLQ